MLYNLVFGFLRAGLIRQALTQVACSYYEDIA